MVQPEQNRQVRTPEQRAERAWEAIEKLLGEMSPTEHGGFLHRLLVLAKTASEKGRLSEGSYFDALMFYVTGHLKKLLDEADDSSRREHYQRHLGMLGIEHANSFIAVFEGRLGVTPRIEPTSASRTIASDEQSQFFSRLQALCEEKQQQLERTQQQQLEPRRRTIGERIRGVFGS